MLNKALKRLFVSLMTIILFCLLSLYSSSVVTNAFNYTHGIMFNQYYRIKNVSSGLYLTMNSSSDAENVGCSLQERSMYDSKQMFYLTIDYNLNTYYFSPRSSTSGRVLSLSTPANIIYNSVVLKTNTSSNQMKWTITKTEHGYRIAPYSCSYVMAPLFLSNNVGTDIATWSFQSYSTEWLLEPVYSGTSNYYAITTLDPEDSSAANTIVNNIGNMYYSSYRTDLPIPAMFHESVPSSRINIFHGHGMPGYIQLQQYNAPITKLYSENPPSGGVEYNYFSNRNSYVVFVTCYSAAEDLDNNRCSMVDAAYNNGACCVTGFKDQVAGGEDYLNLVIFRIKWFPGTTIAEAMNAADYYYEGECEWSKNPSNTDNRKTVGFSNICIDMR